MFDQWIKSQGKLSYEKGNRLVAYVNDDLTHFYRSLIPKYIYFNTPKYYPHITIVRGKYEVPLNKKVWNKYNGEKIEFRYSPNIQIDNLYIWIPVESKDIKNIRRELGLPDYPHIFKTYHITIGNKKNIN